MSARIVVSHGPERGQAFELSAGSVRIGPGSNADLRLTDPGLHGDLLLEPNDGVVLVTNLLPTAVYLDRQPLESGHQRVWLDDTDLQPTALTKLRLTRTPSPKVQPRPRSSWAQGLLIGSLVLFALALLAPNDRALSTSKVDAVAVLQQRMEELEKTSPELAQWPGWHRLREQLARGRADWLMQRPTLAAQHFREANQLAEDLQRDLERDPRLRHLGGTKLPKLLTDIRESVNRELIEIARFTRRSLFGPTE